MKMVENLLKKKQQFDSYLSYTPSQLSSYSFVYLFIWQDFFSYEFKIIDDCLCIFAKDQAGVFMHLPPLGSKISLECIQECFRHMQKVNKASRLSRIENERKDQLSIYSTKQYTHILKSNEYCYKRMDVAELKGNLYKSKRSSYNQASKNYYLILLPYEISMLEDCLKLYRAWAKTRLAKHKDEMFKFMIEDNLKVHRRALTFFKELGLVGRVVKLNKKIVGYTFGYEINPDCFCVLFEIVDLSIKGLAVYIFKQFCEDSEIKKYHWINAMDDFNQPELKKTKMSFHPAKLIPSYSIQEREHGTF